MPKYFKVTNYIENHHGFQYYSGLNVLNDIFNDDINNDCAPGGLYISDLQHIHNYYEYGMWLREIDLPKNDPEFKIVKLSRGKKYRANKLILGQRHDLFDPDTVIKFGLKINYSYLDNLFNLKDNYILKKWINHILSYLRYDCFKNNIYHMEDWDRIDSDCYLSSILNYTTQIIERLISSWYQYGLKLKKSPGFRLSQKNLRWLRIGLNLIYICQPINNSSNTYIMELWKSSNLPIIYDYNAICEAIKSNDLNVLKWWLNSGLKMKYYESIIMHICRHNRLEILDWWFNSGLPFIYDHRIIDMASGSNDLDIINWFWQHKDQLTFKYSHLAIDNALQRHHILILNWWIDSGLELKYTQPVLPYSQDKQYLNMLDWWYHASLKSNQIKLEYDDSILYFASVNNDFEVLKWWQNKGLKIKIPNSDLIDDLNDYLVKTNHQNIVDWWLSNSNLIKHKSCFCVSKKIYDIAYYLGII